MRILNKAVSVLLIALIMTGTSVLSCFLTAADSVYTEKDVKAYLFGMDKSETLECLFNDSVNVPYIGAADFFEQIYNNDYSVTKNGDIYTVSCKNGSMIIDAVKDTIHFDCFETFILNDSIDLDMSSEYVRYEPFKIFGEKPVDLDLSAYGIDIAENNGMPYLPVTVLSDIVSSTYAEADYINGNIYFTPSYVSDDYYFDRSSLFDELSRDKNEISFAYKELCFVMENFYGRPERLKTLGDSIEEKGFDRTLIEFSEDTKYARELLLSSDAVDYYFGLRLLSYIFYDGGHTGFDRYRIQRYPDSALYKAVAKIDRTDKRYTSAEKYTGSVTETRRLYSEIGNERNNAFKTLSAVKEWTDESGNIISSYGESGNTGIYTFDVFDLSVPQQFKWSLDKAEEDDMENFVIDLSYNGGGETSIVSYIMSIISGSSDIDYCLEISGNYYREKSTVDRNLDGLFNDEDNKVKYDFNYAVLTSPLSFSCGNMLPTLAKDNGIAIMGDVSGGGSCVVFKGFYPNGMDFNYSGFMKLVNSDRQETDLGVQPDCSLVKINSDGTKDYSGLYDFNSYDRIISDFYSGGVLGDASTDGRVTILDPSYIQKSISDMIILSERGCFLADVDRNDEVEIKDASYIQYYLAGLSCPEDIGKTVKRE